MALQRLTALFVALMLLFGCIPAHNLQTPTQPSIEEATTSSEKVNTPGADSRRIHLRTPQTVYMYRYFMDAGIYEKEATTYTGELTLLDVVKFIAKASGLEEPLPIFGAYSDGNGGDIIDFKQALVDRLDKRTLYTFLGTLVMTLRQNMISSGPVYLYVEGDVSIFEGYEPPTLELVSNSDFANFTEICKSIPYDGLRTIVPQNYPSVLAAPSDATALEVFNFLSILPYFDRNAASPAELDQQMLTISCILATNFYSSIPKEGLPVQYYRKELQPIADAIEAKLGGLEDMFWIAEHVQKTAKLLYGDDFNLQLTEESCKPWRYFETEGVITPSHRGGGDSSLPVILSYEAIVGGYRVEAVYIYKGMEGYDIGDGVEIPEQSLADAVNQKAPRREILLKRAKDGKLRFVSHRFL